MKIQKKSFIGVFLLHFSEKYIFFSFAGSQLLFYLLIYLIFIAANVNILFYTTFIKYIILLLLSFSYKFDALILMI